MKLSIIYQNFFRILSQRSFYNNLKLADSVLDINKDYDDDDGGMAVTNTVQQQICFQITNHQDNYPNKISSNFHI